MNGGTMASKDRVGHNRKRAPQHDLMEKRQARRAEKQAQKSSKRKRRESAAHHPTA
jgi:hypothetical protein